MCTPYFPSGKLVSLHSVSPFKVSFLLSLLFPPPPSFVFSGCRRRYRFRRCLADGLTGRLKGAELGAVNAASMTRARVPEGLVEEKGSVNSGRPYAFSGGRGARRGVALTFSVPKPGGLGQPACCYNERSYFSEFAMYRFIVSVVTAGAVCADEVLVDRSTPYKSFFKFSDPALTASRKKKITWTFLACFR